MQSAAQSGAVPDPASSADRARTGRLSRLVLHPGAIGAAAAVSVAVPLLDADWRTASHHGFFHHAIVYRIFEHGVPPENPFFAGEPLRYPYGIHLILAAVMKLVPLAPQWWFALLNLATIVLFALIVDRLARHIDRDPVVRACACLLALTGLNPLTRGWIAKGFRSIGWPIEPSSLPWHKFITINASQVGAVIVAAALLVLARCLNHRSAPWDITALGVLTLAAAFIYPHAWIVVVLWIGITAVEQLVWGRSPRTAAALGASALLAGVLAAPYLRAVSGARASALQYVGGLADLRRHGAVLLPALLVAGILVLTGRKDLERSWRENAELASLLVLLGFASLGLFFATRLPLDTEYKFFIFGMIPFAVLLAPAFRLSLCTRPLLGGTLLCLLLWPIGAKSARSLTWKANDPASSTGRYLRAARAEEDALYQWMVSSTPPEATFIDLRRTIPVFARRSLFVALDEPAVTLHAVTGAPLAAVERRRALAEALVGERDAAHGEVGARLREEAAGRPLYVVARTAEARERAAAIGGSERVYDARNAAVFLLR